MNYNNEKLNNIFDKLEVEISSSDLDRLILDNDVARDFILNINRMNDNLWWVGFQDRRNLMEKIKREENSSWSDVLFETPESWNIDIKDLLSRIKYYCLESGISLPIVMQIKEKYNELRVYISFNEDWNDKNYSYVEDMIEQTNQDIKKERR